MIVYRLLPTHTLDPALLLLLLLRLICYYLPHCLQPSEAEPTAGELWTYTFGCSDSRWCCYYHNGYNPTFVG